MKKILVILALLYSATPALACDHYSRLYNTATTLNFNLWLPDGTAHYTSTAPVAGDILVSQSEGAEANCANTSGNCVTDEGSFYSIALEASELDTARVYIAIRDVSGAAWLDKCLIVHTYGNASAQFPSPDVNVASHSTAAKAEINAEVLDVLNTDTFAELSALPGASPTIVQMIQWSYQMARFKLTATSSEQKLYKADSSTVLGTSTLSDDGTTFTRGKSN